MKITAEPITIAMQTPFRISRGSRTECHVVRVYIEHGDKQAQGECTPYPRYGESSESVLAQIQQASNALEAMFERGVTDPAELRDHLQSLLTGGQREMRSIVRFGILKLSRTTRHFRIACLSYLLKS